jgi:hypothetical protein
MFQMIINNFNSTYLKVFKSFYIALQITNITAGIKCQITNITAGIKCQILKMGLS